MLKISTLFAALILSSSIIAQTSVISTKSHSAEIKNLVHGQDGFGGREMNFRPEPMDPIKFHSTDKFEVLYKIDDHCVIRKGIVNDLPYKDTMCNYWYYEQHNYNKQSMRDFHGQDILLIGFPENAPVINKNDAPFSGRTSRFSISWIFILLTLGSFGGFVLLPKSKV